MLNSKPQSRFFNGRALAIAAMIFVFSLTTASAQTNAAPTASAVALARQIVVNTEQKTAFQASIAQMMDQLTANTLRTHPEVAADLKVVLTQLEPSFMQDADTMVDKAAIVYAKLFSEAELKQVNDFYASPTGRKFASLQPLAYQQIGDELKPWRAQLSLKMIDEMRDEMKKKGHDL